MAKRPSISIRAATYAALKKQIDKLPKSERHGAIGRFVDELITRALDAQENK